MKDYKFFINTSSGKYLFFYKGIEVYAAANSEEALNIFHQNLHDSVTKSDNFVKAKDSNGQVLILSLYQAITLVVEQI